MKYFVVFVALIPFFVISLNPVFAMCANDPVNPNTPCDDLIETLILDLPQTQIEKIDDVLYYVSVPFDHYSSADKIIFQEVTFSPPYTFEPPRHTYTDVIFADGSNETISILFDDPAFTKHVNPQAGFISRTSGSHFLVSVNLDELSPLEQFRYGIPLNKIQCKDSLVLIKKYDGSPACVTESTKQKLIEREWSKTMQVKVTRQAPTVYLGPTDIPSANNQFALNFYSHVSQDKERNIFFSPTSIFTAFAIAYEGAKENTAKEMEDVFGFEPNESQRRKMFAETQEILNPESKDYALLLANALWLDKNFKPLPEYIDTTKTYYDSKVEPVDFSSNDTVPIINEWVSKKTKGNIDQLFDELDPKTKFAITNAIYFNGTWINQFDKDNTRDSIFNVNPEKKVKVPMMFTRDVPFNHVHLDLLEILEMPYNGNRLSMLILLPSNDSNLRSLEESFTLMKLSEWRHQLSQKTIPVQIPKFTLDTDYDLIEILTGMGISSLFDERSANLGTMTDDYDGLHVSIAIHKAFADVNEEGTEAAAATGIGGYMGGYPTFLADRPFMFLIQDNETGQILFMGRMVDPTK